MQSRGEARRRLVCRCLGVASFRIYAAVREHDLSTVPEVTKHTRAGGGCGTCHPEIEEILAEVRGEPVDPGIAVENRLVCDAETRARVEGSLESLVLPALAEREVTLDGLEIEGLRVRVRLGGRAADEAYALVAETLRTYVCADLEVEPLR